MAELLGSIFDPPIVPSWYLGRDEALTLGSAGSAIFVHPLEVVRLKHPNDPLGRLDEAMSVLVRHACARLDDVARRLGGQSDA